jgi:hypothetical protein
LDAPSRGEQLRLRRLRVQQARPENGPAADDLIVLAEGYIP